MTGYLAGRPGHLLKADSSGRKIECKRDWLRYAALGCAALAALWIAAFLQWSLHDQVVPWDSKNQFYAFYRFMAGAIESAVAVAGGGDAPRRPWPQSPVADPRRHRPLQAGE